MALNVTVTIKGADPVDVPVINPDRIRWDMTRAKQKWPSFEEAPFLGTTFLAWSAMKREGLYNDTFENFRDRDAIDIQSFDDEDNDDDTIEGVGNPTQ